MKIKQEHFAILEREIVKVMKKYPNIYQEYKKAGLSNMRYRFDLLHAAPLHISDSHNCHGNSVRHVIKKDGTTEIIPLIDLPLYDYMNSDHIDTALRKITNTR